jgi:hypothetical protein
MDYLDALIFVHGYTMFAEVGMCSEGRITAYAWIWSFTFAKETERNVSKIMFLYQPNTCFKITSYILKSQTCETTNLKYGLISDHIKKFKF